MENTPDTIIPLKDFLFGGGVLIVVFLFHAVGSQLIMNHFLRLSAEVRRMHFGAAYVLLISAVSGFLLLHLLEISMWTTAIVSGGLLASWREAAFFAANAYTTVGYGTDLMPEGWKMLGPIIAISGLFTFGWTGSLLVTVMTTYNQLLQSVKKKQ